VSTSCTVFILEGRKKGAENPEAGLLLAVDFIAVKSGLSLLWALLSSAVHSSAAANQLFQMCKLQ
jgi:hypothetical protein